MPEPDFDAMASVQLPEDADPQAALDTTTAITPVHRLNTQLWKQYALEVPVFHWPAPPRKLLRISAQAYNCPAHYRRLAEALRHLPIQ